MLRGLICGAKIDHVPEIPLKFPAWDSSQCRNISSGQESSGNGVQNVFADFVHGAANVGVSSHQKVLVKE